MVKTRAKQNEDKDIEAKEKETTAKKEANRLNVSEDM